MNTTNLKTTTSCLVSACQAADRLRPTAGDQDHVNPRSPAAPLSNSNKTACSTGGRARRAQAGQRRAVLGEQRQVGGGQHPGRCAETARPNLRGATDQHAIPLLDGSLSRIGTSSAATPLADQFPTITVGFYGVPQGLRGAPEERWASWQGQTAKSQDFQVPRCCQPSQDREDGTGRA